jgi:hypothetical protein
MRKILTLLALSAALQAQAASLEIEITGMQGVEGQVLVALFDRAETWLTRPLQVPQAHAGGRRHAAPAFRRSARRVSTRIRCCTTSTATGASTST